MSKEVPTFIPKNCPQGINDLALVVASSSPGNREYAKQHKKVLGLSSHRVARVELTVTAGGQDV